MRRVNFGYKGKITTVLVGDSLYHLTVLLEMAMKSKEFNSKDNKISDKWGNAYDYIQGRFHDVFCDLFPKKDLDVCIADISLDGEVINITVTDW